MNSTWFDWDIGNGKKCQDLKHSDAELRQIAIGRTLAGRFAFVVFTLRDGKVRPLSARFMHAKEVRRYAKGP